MRFVSVLLGLLGTACAPFIVVPGSELRGTLASGAIDDWIFTDAVEYVQLETRPEAPYSVQVYGVGSRAAFYIASQGWRAAVGSAGDARWVAHISEDPRVRLRIGETLYERRAVRVEDTAELESVVTLFETKYGEGRPVSMLREQLEQAAPAEWDGVGIFRLDPR